VRYRVRLTSAASGWVPSPGEAGMSMRRHSESPSTVVLDEAQLSGVGTVYLLQVPDWCWRCRLKRTSEQLQPVIAAMGGQLPELLPGYRVRILDGNHLAATDRRLKVIRRSKAVHFQGRLWSSSIPL